MSGSSKKRELIIREHYNRFYRSLIHEIPFSLFVVRLARTAFWVPITVKHCPPLP